MTYFRFLVIIVCCLMFQQLLNAQTSYTSVSSGIWNDPNIWSPVGVPGAGDIVFIDQGTTVSTNGQREVAGFNTLVGGELALSSVDGSLTITGNANWGGTSGGGIIRDATSNNNGTVIIANGAVMEITGQGFGFASLYGGARLLNQGIVRIVSSGISGQDSSIIENQSLFEIIADNAGFGGTPNGGHFINTGIFRNLGNGTCSFNANWEFRNMGGTIDVQSGTIAFNCDGIFMGGSYNADAGALLHFDSRNHTFEGTLSGAPAGRIEISAGVTANTGVSGVTFDFQGTGLVWNGGTFTGSMITIPGNSLLVLSAVGLTGGSTLLNLGTIRQDGSAGISAQDSSIVDNQSLYEIIADNAGFGGTSNGGHFINTGIFRNLGNGTCSFNANWEFRNLAGGIIDAAKGIIAIANFENAQNAIIQGIASVNVYTTFTNDGINSPGNSAGLLTFIGNYIPSSTGVLEIELGGMNSGSEYDQLAVTGNANLNGALNISLFGGFIPAIGDSFVVLTTTGSVSDSFMTVNAQTGLYVHVNYNSNNVTVVVDSVSLTSVEDITGVNIITNYDLSQNYPNPFNPSTTISWQSPVGSWQTLKVYDLLGNEIATLVDEYKPAGSYEVDFDATGISSGIYFYKLQTGGFVETKKMILLR